MEKLRKQQKSSPITGSVKIYQIKKFMEARGLSEQQFANKCKIELKDLQKVLDDYSLFEPIVLLKIARTMGVDFADLVN